MQAVLRADQIIAQVWGNDPSAVLFDPARVPALAERADAEAAGLHQREGEASRERALGLPQSVHYDTHDGNADYDPDAPAEQGVVRIWRVGSNHVDIARDRWHDSPNRVQRPADYFASILRHTVDKLDHWDCTEYGCDRESCDLKCNVHIAKACAGTTRLLPVNRGTLILLFRCCEACEDLAGKIAENTYKTNAKIAEMEAREDLPPDTP